MESYLATPSISSPTTMVFYFTGTLAKYKGRQTENHLNIELEEEDLEQNFGFLSDCIKINETYVRGFNGSHSALGIFAFDLEKTANECFALIKEQAAKTPNQITLILETYSRGSMSALLLIKEKIQQDEDLRDRVTVTAIMRGPVPGNFNITARMDKMEVTAAKQCYDLTHCSFVKKVHIFAFEEGNRLPYVNWLIPGFDILIPKFANNTTVDIEYLPGNHMIVEKNPGILNYDNKHHIYTAHPLISQLNLFKSLQIYLENGVSIDYQKALAKIETLNLNINQQIASIYDEITNQEDKKKLNNIKAYVMSLFQLIHKCFQPNVTSQPFIDKNSFYIFLLEAQSYIYTLLLNEFRNDPEIIQHVRTLHFTGDQLGKTTTATNANFLNIEHANLYEKLECNLNPTSHFYPQPLFGFKRCSHRRDINEVHKIKALDKCALLLIELDQEIIPTCAIFDGFRIQQNSLYLKDNANNKFFYLNKKTNECSEIKLDKADWIALDNEIKTISHNAHTIKSPQIYRKSTKLLPGYEGVELLSLSRIDLDKISKITNHQPSKVFETRYQRIMFILQKITSDCKIPSFTHFYEVIDSQNSNQVKSNEKIKYIDKLKNSLFAIANNERLSDNQKMLAMDCFIINLYRHLKYYEGLFPSRLRLELEAMMAANSILGFKERYGINMNIGDEQVKNRMIKKLSSFLNQTVSLVFSKKPVTQSKNQADIAVSYKKNEGQLPYQGLAENDHKLYEKIVKFLVNLNQVASNYQHYKDELSQKITRLLQKEVTLSNSQTIMQHFSDILFSYYSAIRMQQKRGYASFFIDNSSCLGNFIEKFMAKELAIQVPHVYSENTKAQFDELKAYLAITDEIHHNITLDHRSQSLVYP